MVKKSPCYNLNAVKNKRKKTCLALQLHFKGHTAGEQNSMLISNYEYHDIAVYAVSIGVCALKKNAFKCT